MLTYILVRDGITVTASGVTQVEFKNCTPFIKCITKIHETTLVDAGNLNLVMYMYNLTEYSPNYCETTESLRFYCKDEATNFNIDIANTDDFKCFKRKAKLLGNTFADGKNGVLRNAAIAVPLKSLCNFRGSLEMSFINFKLELKLKSWK